MLSLGYHLNQHRPNRCRELINRPHTQLGLWLPMQLPKGIFCFSSYQCGNGSGAFAGRFRDSVLPAALAVASAFFLSSKKCCHAARSLNLSWYSCFLDLGKPVPGVNLSPVFRQMLNSGGGGGGSKFETTSSGGNGGSGVVIIRYPNTFADAVSTTGSPTFTNTGGNKIYKFTGSGSITF